VFSGCWWLIKFTLGFSYDIVGEAISVATLAESTSQAGKIHITQGTYQRLDPKKFIAEEREQDMNAKRHGPFKTFFLLKKLE
jgi:class 3 adenylate cyclase